MAHCPRVGQRLNHPTKAAERDDLRREQAVERRLQEWREGRTLPAFDGETDARLRELLGTGPGP